VPRAAGGRGLDIGALLAALDRRAVRSVLLEGGPTLAAAFTAAGALDKVVGYIAPVLLGAGPTAFGDCGVTTIGQALRLSIAETTRIGPDLRVTAYRSHRVPSVPAPEES
jgi:diaminohydroxyphosphoribosylaminopyrimidine deaminase/5-amino-6-(5-phosphoribosylamino)uracil reductase